MKIRVFLAPQSGGTNAIADYMAANEPDLGGSATDPAWISTHIINGTSALIFVRSRILDTD